MYTCDRCLKGTISWDGEVQEWHCVNCGAEYDIEKKATIAAKVGAMTMMDTYGTVRVFPRWNQVCQVLESCPGLCHACYKSKRCVDDWDNKICSPGRMRVYEIAEKWFEPTLQQVKGMIRKRGPNGHK